MGGPGPGGFHGPSGEAKLSHPSGRLRAPIRRALPDCVRLPPPVPSANLSPCTWRPCLEHRSKCLSPLAFLDGSPGCGIESSEDQDNPAVRPSRAPNLVSFRAGIGPVCEGISSPFSDHLPVTFLLLGGFHHSWEDPRVCGCAAAGLRLAAPGGRCGYP